MNYQEQPAQVALRLRESATKNGWMGRVTANGWSFAYNRPVRGNSAMNFYGFSAMLQPKCRSSSVEDWEYLGQVMKAMEMPEPTDRSKFLYYTDLATEDPNSVLKWLWNEEAK